jgi:excisionase family DNA binding protein
MPSWDRERKDKMYITIKETAEYLNLPESTVKSLIQQRKIRTIHDGEQFLVYKEQFNTHLKQIEKYKSLVEEYLSEPIPEDRDIKDED